MWNTIRKLVDSGSTILLTTQYLDEADQLADRIAVIDKGKVVAEGTPSELKASVGRTRLQLKLENAGDSPKALTIVQDVLKVKAQLLDSTNITAPMTDPEGVTDVLVALRKAGIHLIGVSVQEPTLDEVFFALTGSKVTQEEVNDEAKGETK
jgi:ABC-2 type transport system ATP-binding protein